jgi:hypothetical protein
MKMELEIEKLILFFEGVWDLILDN